MISLWHRAAISLLTVLLTQCHNVSALDTIVKQAAPGTVETMLPATSEGDNALNVCDYSRAEKYFASALQNIPKDANNEGYLRTGYGEALLWQDKVSEAADQFKKARKLILGKNGSNDIELQVRLWDDLASLAEAQNKPALALQNAEESVRLGKADAKIKSLSLVSSLTHLAVLLEKNESLEKASSTFAEALTAELQANGPESLLAADIKEELGAVLRRLGQTQEANKYFVEALQVKFATNAPLTGFAPHPYWNDVIFRFHEGAPNCLRKLENGRDLEIITANGITIAAAVSTGQTDLVKSGQVELSVKNDSEINVQLLPKPPIFYVLAPKIMLARQLDAASLASKVERKGEKKAGWIRFMGADATRPVTTTFIGNGGYFGFPPVYSYNGAAPFVSRSGNMTTVTTQVPDYAAQARALAKAAAVSERARETADQIRNQSLAATTLSPGEFVRGSLYFDVGKIEKSTLQVPVGNAWFQFDFPSR